MESMMGGGDKSAPKPISYEQAGTAKKVGQWTCTPYRVKGDAPNREELCVARMTEVGLKRDDLKALESLSTFMRQMVAAGPAAARPAALDIEGLSKEVGYDAVPVQMSQLADDGKVEFQTTVQKVEHKSIAADMFEIPAGYTKQAMPRMPGARPQ
jgi:hypothetical protein